MRLHSAWAIAALVLLPAAAPQTVSADHDLLLSGGGVGGGWASFSVSAASDEVEVELDYVMDGRELRFFIEVFDSRGEVVRALSGWHYRGPSSYRVVHVGLDLLPTLQIEDESSPPPAASPWPATLALPRGEWRVLVWLTDAVADWSFTVAGGPADSAALGFGGNRVVDLGPEDFSEVAVRTSCCPALVRTSGLYGAHVAMEGRVEVGVDSTFHGFFKRGGGPHAWSDLRVRTPDGVEHACTCAFGNFTEASPGPGTYVFLLESVGLEATFGGIRALGVDARLPKVTG